MPIWPLALRLVLRIFRLCSYRHRRSIEHLSESSSCGINQSIVHRTLDDGELPYKRSPLTSHLDGVAVDYRFFHRHRDRRDESAKETSIVIERQADLSGVGADAVTCLDAH